MPMLTPEAKAKILAELGKALGKKITILQSFLTQADELAVWECERSLEALADPNKPRNLRVKVMKDRHPDFVQVEYLLGFRKKPGNIRVRIAETIA